MYVVKDDVHVKRHKFFTLKALKAWIFYDVLSIAYNHKWSKVQVTTAVVHFGKVKRIASKYFNV